MLAINNVAKSKGIEYYTAFPNARSMRGKGDNDSILIGTRLGRNLHILLAKMTGLHGCFSILDTHFFLKKVKKINPDIIHLHNIHGDYINIQMLFKYIKRKNIKVVWTLHDCWTFTGQCPHFDMIGCDKWKTGCYKCPQFKEYPKSMVDNSKLMYKLKKKWFTGVENLTIVTPSQWLADLVKQSYLKEYPVQVINNGINLNIFKPTESNFREKYNLQNKYIILGIAFGWGERKGLDVFIDLAKRLDEMYQIILVGTDENIDKKLPSNILSIHRTQNQVELAEIYTAADLFINPTREDTFPTTNIEALACGTPVITFDTGGSPEIIDNTCGISVKKDSISDMVKAMRTVCEGNLYQVKPCVTRAEQYNKNEKFQEYINVYANINKYW